MDYMSTTNNINTTRGENIYIDKENVTARSACECPNVPNNNSDHEEWFYISNKYAWALAVVPSLVSWIVAIGTLMIPEILLPAILTTIVAFVLQIVFLIKDMNELKKADYEVDAWMWLFGFILVPVYLFVRAARTDKKYGYAIAWCVIFVAGNLIAYL